MCSNGGKQFLFLFLYCDPSTSHDDGMGFVVGVCIKESVEVFVVI